MAGLGIQRYHDTIICIQTHRMRYQKYRHRVENSCRYLPRRPGGELGGMVPGANAQAVKPQGSRRKSLLTGSHWARAGWPVRYLQFTQFTVCKHLTNKNDQSRYVHMHTPRRVAQQLAAWNDNNWDEHRAGRQPGNIGTSQHRRPRIRFSPHFHTPTQGHTPISH